MANERSLVKKYEDGVEHWGCSACRWLYHTRKTAEGMPPREDLKVAFRLHQCERNLLPGERYRAEPGYRVQTHITIHKKGSLIVLAKSFIMSCVSALESCDSANFNARFESCRPAGESDRLLRSIAVPWFPKTGYQ